VELRDATPREEPGRSLVRELWTDMAARYAGDPSPTAAQSNGEPSEGDDLHLDELDPPAGRFVVVYDDGAAVACGGIRRHDDETAEIKRMYVRPVARGRGISRVVLEELERTAVRAGYRALILETGLRQPEAMTLYESAGYTRIPNYGYYRESELSACYRKELPVG
jgi:GNAT superfamily N-acetyltransferase